MRLVRSALALSTISLLACADPFGPHQGQPTAGTGAGNNGASASQPAAMPDGGTGSTTTTSTTTPTSDPKCDPKLLDLAGCVCPGEGATRKCYTGPAGSENVGACKDGQQSCGYVGEFLVWSACSGDVLPSAENCSGTGDENCNGLTGCNDPSCTGLAGCCAAGTQRSCYDGPPGTSGVGLCAAGMQTCDASGAWQACTGETTPGSEAGHCTDGIDNDCNGQIDCADVACVNDPACAPPICTPGATRGCYDGAAGTQNVGQCRGGTQTCASDGKSWSTTCAGEVLPGSEAGHCSDGIDNDCNGPKDCQDPACNGDPACACVPGTTRSCYTGPAGTENVGICHDGTQTCNSVGSAWGPCVGEGLPSVEAGACTDGLDNDCNGFVDCNDPACTFDAACCVPTTSYDTTIYATSGTSLYVIHPSDWSETQIGSYGVTEHMTDIAMTPDGNLYTVSATSLYRVDRTSGAATFALSLSGSQNNAITFLPDSRLLGADATGMLKVIDPVAGTVTNIGNYSNGLTSSGDLVAVGDGTMFGVSPTGSGASTSNNLLITVDTSSGVAAPVGSTGFANVFGMAYYGSRVIAFTGSGQILELNPSSGAGTLLATHGHAYFGGTTSPLVPINGCF
jgi:hypothetical protein